jgi:hypothetical protein
MWMSSVSAMRAFRLRAIPAEVRRSLRSELHENKEIGISVIRRKTELL